MNIEQLFSLDGRTALITGGSAGLGRMICEAFIAAGAKVYISSRKEAACRETAESLGSNCIAMPEDLSTVAGCEALAKRLSQAEPHLDILVNNAGVAWGEEFDSFSETGWDKVIDLNLKSPFFLTQKLYPLLKKAAQPSCPAKVINIASVDGMRLNSWETYSYQASKAGLIQLTRRMAARLVRDHINVTAIAPGAFASNMNRAARDRGETVARAIPGGRLGDSVDIGASAIFLAARSGDYIIGETLVVDGGLVHAELGASMDG